ncbi:MAG TPA: hypothetical protein VN704_05405 [Verrucomicrobiae bacterium]|nr:hypothetical protein [Verrucomicrobiae bacterium]
MSTIIILTSLIIQNIYGISKEKLKDNPPNSTSTAPNVIEKSHQINNTAKSTTSFSFINNNNNNKDNGILNVMVRVDNKNSGNKTPSDFTIIIYANDPSPLSFFGNLFGTKVNLGMGMYSVSESSDIGYVSKYTSDCFGGIMSATLKIS